MKSKSNLRLIQRVRLWRLLVVLTTLCALLWQAMPARATTRQWTHNSSQLWSDPQNWNPTGTPQAGDDLLFIDDANLTGPNPMINDLVGVTVNSMGFRIVYGYFGTSDWVLNGNPISLTLGIATDETTADEHVYINCDLILGSDIHILAPYSISGSDVAIHLTGALNLNGHTLGLFGSSFGSTPTLVDLSGVISGTGNVVASGSVVALSGSQANTFHGTLIVAPAKSDHFGADTFGDVQLNKQSGVAVPERLRVEKSSRVTLLHSEQIADDATVEIIGDINQYGHTGGGSLLLNGFNETIGNLVMTNYAGDTNFAAPTLAHCLLDTGGGTVTLNGDVTARCDIDYANPLILGRLSLAPGVHNITTYGSAYAGLDMQAELTGLGNFHKLGNSALILEANNTFNSSISIDDGILDVRNDHALGDIAGDTSLFGGSNSHFGRSGRKNGGRRPEGGSH
jgi:autotransporter-associated beta strand protein